MAFNGLRFATLEWKNLVSSKAMWVVAGAIAVIPLLYGALYLAAFEDPYARLDAIPVAVVNEDEGAQVNGVQRVMGDEVVSSLKASSDGLGWHFVSAKEAQRGLESGAFFMTCTIPSDFSARIASAETASPQQAQLLVEYNQGANMLASQIGRSAWREVQQQVSAAVARQYWTAAFARISATASQLTQAASGAGALEAGLARAQEGNATITDKLGELYAGSARLAAGLDRMQQAVDELPSRLDALGGQLRGLGSQAEQALSGASESVRQVEQGLAELADAAALFAQQVDAAQEGDASAYDPAAVARLEAGARELADGLTEARAQLEAAAPALRDTAALLAADAEELSASVPELVEGVDAAAAGADSLQSGAGQLEAGSAELGAGLGEATEGAAQLSSRLGEGAQEAAAQSANAAGRARVMSDPVALAETDFTSVRNYGTGFAPYFMALALWVGGLVAGFVFKPLNGRLVLSGAHPVTAALANYLPMALFACIQATLLMLVVQFGLKLQVNDVAGFYAVGYVTALVFAAIMQLLAAALGVPGRFAGILLLMLQLTSSAGTFPVQTTPTFFQTISPYMPMTYVVEAFRQVTAGIDAAAAAQSCAVLFCMGVACFALTCVVAHRRRTVRMDDLHPLISLS